MKIYRTQFSNNSTKFISWDKTDWKSLDEINNNTMHFSMIYYERDNYIIVLFFTGELMLYSITRDKSHKKKYEEIYNLWKIR